MKLVLLNFSIIIRIYKYKLFNINRKFIMKGTLLDFNIQLNEGAISGEDGKRYSFFGSRMERASSTCPEANKLILL
jgi:hypothetical protein